MKFLFFLTLLIFSCDTKQIEANNDAVLRFEHVLFIHQLSADSALAEQFIETESLRDANVQEIEKMFRSDLRFRETILARIKLKNDSLATDSTLIRRQMAFKRFVLNQHQ